jgi:O-antigen/teichoic acid export membrane protein
MLSALFKSASLRAAAVLGLGGLAFTLGNLLFARALPAQEYGVVSLFIGIVAVAGLAAPLGLDLVIGRRGLLLDSRWRRAIAGTTFLVGLATAVVSAILYRLEAAIRHSLSARGCDSRLHSDYDRRIGARSGERRAFPRPTAIRACHLDRATVELDFAPCGTVGYRPRARHGGGIV